MPTPESTEKEVVGSRFPLSTNEGLGLGREEAPWSPAQGYRKKAGDALKAVVEEETAEKPAGTA